MGPRRPSTFRRFKAISATRRSERTQMPPPERTDMAMSVRTAGGGDAPAQCLRSRKCLHRMRAPLHAAVVLACVVLSGCAAPPVRRPFEPRRPSTVALIGTSATPHRSLTPRPAPLCHPHQLTLSISGGGPAATEQGVALEIATAGSGCSITGWPHIVGHSQAATTVAGRVTSSPAITVPHARPHPLMVGRQHAVYALLIGADATDLRHGGRTCPSSYRTFTLALPQRLGSLRVTETQTQASALTMCGHFVTTPFVPARYVIAKQR